MDDLMTVVINFDIPRDIYLSANDSHGRSWQKKARKVKILRALGAAKYANLPDGRPRMEKARLTVHIRYPDRRNRDAANTSPTIKALVDGIVNGPDPKRFKWVGLLPDDDNKHLIGPDPRPSDELCPKPWVCQLQFVFEAIP